MALQCSYRHLTFIKSFNTKSLVSLLPVCHQKSTLSEFHEDEDKLAPDRKLEYDLDSISKRGYLRNQKPYSPQNNVSETISKIYEKYNVDEDKTLDDVLKYHVLKECAELFSHSVPNSLLHKINEFGDIQTFYQTPVETSTPLDRTKYIDLPKNLHIIYDYERFNPETDTRFGGISAFPESSTIMSNLKAKKKYPGYLARKRSL